MKKKTTKDIKTLPPGHTFGFDESESLSSALGGPTRGFSENAEFDDYEKAGMSFAGPLAKEDAKAKRMRLSSDAAPETDALVDFDDEGELVDGGEISGTQPEVYAGDPNLETTPANDLRFGGEDMSGVSEWSMRARHLELDDGLDAGDFHRSDDDIRAELYELFHERKWTDRPLVYEVVGAEVKLKGKVESAGLLQEIEIAIKDLPGVKEVYNFLEVSSGLPVRGGNR